MYSLLHINCVGLTLTAHIGTAGAFAFHFDELILFVADAGYLYRKFLQST